MQTKTVTLSEYQVRERQRETTSRTRIAAVDDAYFTLTVATGSCANPRLVRKGYQVSYHIFLMLQMFCI